MFSVNVLCVFYAESCVSVYCVVAAQIVTCVKFFMQLSQKSPQNIDFLPVRFLTFFSHSSPGKQTTGRRPANFFRY
jgi:hypothetical protein